MDKMYEMSFFNGPITNKVPLTTLGLIEVAAIVKSKELEPQTVLLRSITDHYAAGQWQRQELEWVDERLRTQLEDMLRGLDRMMAQEVVGCILYFINWGIRNYLDLWHIDGMLKTAYNKIEHAASQQGIKLPMFP